MREPTGYSTFQGWKRLQANLLDIAAYDFQTRTLGPGVRTAIWVNGCCFACKGCIAAEWISPGQKNWVQIDSLVDKIIGLKEVDGLTLSGGEPMLQATGLLNLIRQVRLHREINVICFTGFTVDELKFTPPSNEIQDFLSEIDLLIDGRYQFELNDDRGLRGSNNQQFHHLSNKLKHIDFELYPRKIEVSVNSDYVLVKGVPTKHGLSAINRALQKLG